MSVSGRCAGGIGIGWRDETHVERHLVSCVWFGFDAWSGDDAIKKKGREEHESCQFNKKNSTNHSLDFLLNLDIGVYRHLDIA